MVTLWQACALALVSLFLLKDNHLLLVQHTQS
jgi:hypothetical protein